MVNIETARQLAAKRLMGFKHVVGVGIGQDRHGEHLVVLVERLPSVELPDRFEGHRVKVRVVGEVREGASSD